MKETARLCIFVSMVGLVALAATSSPAGPDQSEPAASTTRKVLFMCPHGAAKSVLASAYFSGRRAHAPALAGERPDQLAGRRPDRGKEERALDLG
jgi:hypothetical protein